MQDDDLVLPSSLLELADDDYYGAFHKSYNNVSLKIGIVKKVFEIDDKKNLSKKAPEYDVLTFEQEQNKGITPITYKNCIALDSFGGIADFMDFRKIVPTNNPDFSTLDKDDGSFVLLLCIDGSNTKGVIIGALPHHARKATLSKDSGHHMEGEYNGLRVKVNKDGELTITFKGATDNKGKPKDATKGGSQFKMEKDGSVEINDRELDGELKAGNSKDANDASKAPAEYEYFRIDKPKQEINVKTRKNQTYTVGADLTQAVKGNTKMTTKDFVMMAEGKASYTVKGPFEVKAQAGLTISSPSAKMIIDGAMSMQASSVAIKSSSVMLGNGGAPAVIISTQTVGIGNLGAPVISTMMGPFSSTVFIAS